MHSLRIHRACSLERTLPIDLTWVIVHSGSVVAHGDIWVILLHYQFFPQDMLRLGLLSSTSTRLKLLYHKHLVSDSTHHGNIMFVCIQQQTSRTRKLTLAQVLPATRMPCRQIFPGVCDREAHYCEPLWKNGPYC